MSGDVDIINGEDGGGGHHGDVDITGERISMCDVLPVNKASNAGSSAYDPTPQAFEIINLSGNHTDGGLAQCEPSRLYTNSV